MFLSTTIAEKIGIKQVGFSSSFIIVLLFLVTFISDVNHRLFTKFKEEFRIILLAILIIFIKIASGQFNQIQTVLFFFIIPMILSIVLGIQNKTNKIIIRNLILIFFISECLLAIYERIFLINIFPELNDPSYLNYIEDWGFRSTALLGNPLTNALCVSTIMGFIIISTVRLPYKMFLLILGFISLLCFNARAATLVCGSLLVLYLLRIVFGKKTKNVVRISILLFIILSTYFIYLAIVNYGIGGRLVNDEIYDGSAQARIYVFDAFSYIDKNEFWYGNSEKYVYIMNKLGVGGVENSFIVFIINYGVILFIFLSIAYFFWFKRFLKPYTLFDKFILLSSFLVVGSTNNGLASSAPWGFLILGFHCFPFLEKQQQNNFSRKRKMNFSEGKTRLLVEKLTLPQNQEKFLQR